MKQRDFYQVLGIAPAASQGEIRAAYIRLAKRHHPDVAGELPSRLHDVQAAYRCLSDPETRAGHDRLIAETERAHAARQHTIQRRLHGYDRRHPRPLPRAAPGSWRHWSWQSFLLTAAGAAVVARLSLTLLG